jgi:hypothetical protein
MDSLTRDLENRVNDKLRLWIKDSLDLFEMADLDNGGFVVLYALLKALASGLHTIGATPDAAANLLHDIMKKVQDHG